MISIRQLPGALFESRAYMSHLLKAKGPHGVHSPLVYELITAVLNPDKKFYCFDEIEEEREKLLANDTILHVEDYGAGSRATRSQDRSVADIAKVALQSPRCAQAIFRIAHRFMPSKILELGTSLGITTSYLASVNNESQVWTIEGATDIVAQASQVFSNLGLHNVSMVQGKFSERLDETLKAMGSVDFALIDGHHSYEPTLNYFHRILSYAHGETIVLLDDIHWSEEMEKAWNEIRNEGAVTLSLDFFHFGVLLFRKGREKEDFVLRLP